MAVEGLEEDKKMMRYLFLGLLLSSCAIFDNNSAIDYSSKNVKSDYFPRELRAVGERVKVCYSDYIDEKEKKEISFVVLISIDKNGVVEEVVLKSKSTLDKKLANCISYTFYSIKFKPSLNAKGIDITQPYNLLLPE